MPLSIWTSTAVFVSCLPVAFAAGNSTAVGDYIAQGLGQSTSISVSTSTIGNLSSTLSLMVSSTSYVTTDRQSSIPSQSASATTASLKNSTTSTSANISDYACQSAFESWQVAVNNPNLTSYITSTYTATLVTPVTLGYADVYTTVSGIPHAHGNFTSTGTSMYSSVYPDSSISASYLSAPDLPQPSCTIGQSACTSLYSSFRSSLGIGPTASIPNPAIDQPDAPRCQMTGTVVTANSDLPCSVSGSNVQVIYWAPESAASNVSGPATQVFQGHTLTSPSVYLYFDTVGAYRTVYGHENQILTVGPVVTSSMIAMNPGEVSTLVKSCIGMDMSSAVNQIAHGGPNSVALASTLYLQWWQLYTEEWNLANLSVKAVDYAHITQPSPEDYYLGAGQTPYGIYPGVPSGALPNPAETVFDDQYRPLLSVPVEILALDPAWATCQTPLYGIYDPPTALTPQATMAAPSKGPSQASTTSASPIATPASPEPINTGGVSPVPTSSAAQPYKPSASLPDPQASNTPGANTPVPAASGEEQGQSADPGGSAASLLPASTIDGNSGTASSGVQPVISHTADVGGVLASLLGLSGAQETQAAQATSDPTSGDASGQGSSPQDPAASLSAYVIGDQTITADLSSAVVVASQTIAPGSEAIISGTTYSLDPSASHLVVNGATITPAAGTQPSVPAFVVDGHSYTVLGSSGILVETQTVRAGSQTEIDGITYSLNSDGSTLVVNGVTQTLQANDPASPASGYFVVGGKTYTEDPNSGIVISRHTMVAGAQTSIGGTLFSLNSDGSVLVVDGVSQTIQNGALPSAAIGYFVNDGHTYAEGAPSDIVISGNTLSVGTETVLEGTTYSLGGSGSLLVINGVTRTLQVATDPVLTLGSSVYTEDPAISGFAIGSQTLTPGATITLGSGSAAETLREVLTNGELEVLFGTSSTDILTGGSAVASPTTSATPLAQSSVPIVAGSKGSTTTTSAAAGVKAVPASLLTGVAALVVFSIMALR